MRAKGKVDKQKGTEGVSEIKIPVGSYINQTRQLVHHPYTWITTNIRASISSCFSLLDLIYFNN